MEKNIEICMCIAESLCCIAEINTTCKSSILHYKKIKLVTLVFLSPGSTFFPRGLFGS